MSKERGERIRRGGKTTNNYKLNNFSERKSKESTCRPLSARSLVVALEVPPAAVWALVRRQTLHF